MEFVLFSIEIVQQPLGIDCSAGTGDGYEEFQWRIVSYSAVAGKGWMRLDEVLPLAIHNRLI